MLSKLLAFSIILAATTSPIEAGAACDAGFPNANVVESTPTSTFADNADGTVTNNVTGLMWKKCTQGLSDAGCATGTYMGATPMTWSAALSAAVSDTTAGHKDWRLPNKNELESIIESCGSSPAINQNLFPHTPVLQTGFGSYFWSSSSFAADPSVAWIVDFNNGVVDADGKQGLNFVRLVRGGQLFDNFDAQPHLTPMAFGFTAQTGVALSTKATSNTISVNEINGASPISVIGGSYSINGGLYISTAGTVGNGDTISLQQTSSAGYATLTTATLTIGGVSGAFNVTTRALNAMDVDGDGQVDALTDGLILIRYMFGLRGPALTDGAIGAGAMRTSAQIETYIQSVMP